MDGHIWSQWTKVFSLSWCSWVCVLVPRDGNALQLERDSYPRHIKLIKSGAGFLCLTPLCFVSFCCFPSFVFCSQRKKKRRKTRIIYSANRIFTRIYSSFDWWRAPWFIFVLTFFPTYVETLGVLKFNDTPLRYSGSLNNNNIQWGGLKHDLFNYFYWVISFTFVVSF